MQYETKRRSILKAISWRTWATITTALIVFIFTGRFALAITIGLLEVFAKMALYFLHERFWQKIRYGKKEIPAFVVWFTGLPASGKKELADRIYRQLQALHLKVERIDSLDVRPLFPETGFTPEEVNRHVKRAGHLCAMLEKNGVIVVASFVSPYVESRQFVRGVARNFVEVYMKTTVESCEQRDQKGHYAKAKSGQYRHFPGVDAPYDVPESPDITIEVDQVRMDDAARQIIGYLRKRFNINQL
ncbi:MAG: adenylyl-sulfate kinase [Desulfuromonadales bacterium]